MNRFAYELSSYTLKTFSGFSKANIKVYGEEHLPEGSIIFTSNHFTRIETIFLPYHIHKTTKKAVWSLAAAELFNVPVLQGILDNLGAISTRDPHRDELMVKTLLSGDVQWIIFPEGMMVKNKKLIKKDRFALQDNIAVKSPHTGAAVLGLRCEFYRERLRRLREINGDEFDRLVQSLEINDIEKVLTGNTYIVPVNITYYPASPVNSGENNILSRIGKILMKEPSKRTMDELMTEGGMLFSGVDITIRYGQTIPISEYLIDPYIESMLTARRKVRLEGDVTSKQIMRRLSGTLMETYMSAVYSMTSLNYDHILACILKHFPYRKDGIDIYEFKCKVYFAIAWLVYHREYNIWDSFFDNQIHLLTDDRMDRIANFFTLAEKTHVIQIREDKIFKDQTRFVTPSDFHTIRVENPVMVMANEVEPLKEVEHFFKRVAQKSYSDIIENVRDKILEKIAVDFSRDYTRHYSEGESKKKRIGRPIFLKQGKESTGILLIHGYMAAPEEMKSFAHFLHEKSFTVYVPRLKGHGTAPEDLADTSYEQWIESVEEAFVVLRHSCSRVIVGGFSTGAGLALELTSRIKDIKAVFAVAPPMRLQDMGSYFVPAIDTWNAMIKKIHLNTIAKEFIENQPENPHINYRRNPIAGIHQLEKLMDHLAVKLSTINVPALVVQSRKDPVVNPKGTLKLFQGLGSEFKEYYLFDYDRHGILLGEGAERIYKSIENFISQWA